MPVLINESQPYQYTTFDFVYEDNDNGKIYLKSKKAMDPRFHKIIIEFKKDKYYVIIYKCVSNINITPINGSYIETLYIIQDFIDFNLSK